MASAIVFDAQARATARTARGWPMRRAGAGWGGGGAAPGRRRAGPQAAQRGPDPALESGAAHIQRQVDVLVRRVQEPCDGFHAVLYRPIVLHHRGLLEPLREAAPERLGAVAELDRAHAARRGRD